ncbi:hypothetical protein FHETE_9985 [Fusarium heterosporum]|uniref:C2H2-type domain-containing protein n=1 Tax=Fusarium heterosporum TaxID=42747 RepID=A0A8H5SWD0_FUSHE|nr:hypothetical protein FHETE_9985 [Fusarium heterosporum]
MSLDEEILFPPEHYYAADCPNPFETDTLTCPYACGQCEQNFAAAPALERHARASLHRVEWLCRDPDCDMRGKAFATAALYLQHLEESDGHLYEVDSDVAMDTESNFSPYVNSGQGSTDEDVFVSTDFDGNICHEPCCRHHDTDFKCISEYMRHADTAIHRLASKVNKCIISSVPTGLALQAEQQAVRELRCISPHCLMFGQVFKTARAFYKHVSEQAHRDGWSVDLNDQDFEYNSDRDALPGIEFSAGGRKGRCVNDKCPRYGMNFDSYGAMKQHSRSFGHALTEEDLGSTEADDSEEESGDEVWKNSDMHGMEVTECGSLWRCTKGGCRGYGKVMSRLNNVKSHFNSEAHLMAAEELSSSDESLEHLHGMNYSQEERVWKCAKGGCKRFGDSIGQLSDARRHANTNFHTFATKDGSSEPEEFEGMRFVTEEQVWACVSPGCKHWGKFFTAVGYAKRHSRCASHIKAVQNAATPESSVDAINNPQSTPARTPNAQLLTPMDMDASTIYVSPGSPSAGRGIPRPASTPRKTGSTQSPKAIRLRRSPASKPAVEKRQAELEGRNRDLEERIAKLEEQMSRVLSVQSPQAPRLPPPRSPFPQSPSPLTSVPSTPLSSSSVIGTLSRFIRPSFRPRVPLDADEEEL